MWSQFGYSPARVTVTLFYGVIVLQIGCSDIKTTIVYANTQPRVPRTEVRKLEMQLLASIKKKIEILKLNPVYGDQVPRRLWPKELIAKHKLTNVWRVELTNYWRMLYTLRGDKVELICFIIELIDHKRYDRLFGYKKR